MSIEDIVRNYTPSKQIKVPEIRNVQNVLDLYYEPEPGSDQIRYIASELVEIIRLLNLTIKPDSTELAKILFETCNYFDRPLVGICNIHPVIESEEEFKRTFQADAIVTILREAKLI